MRLLVMAAHPSELMHVKAPKGSKHIIEPIGVGMVDAAIGATEILSQNKADLAWLVGTCGVFPRRPISRMSAVEISSFHWADANILQNEAAHVGTVSTRITRKEAFGSHLETVACACTAGITTSDAWAERLAELSKCDVENLEGYAFAHACEHAGIRWRATFVVTNTVGAYGRTEYAANKEAAAKYLGELVNPCL